jgi:hypothetical protein
MTNGALTTITRRWLSTDPGGHGRAAHGRAGSVDGHELLALGEENLDRRRRTGGIGARAGQCEDHGQESGNPKSRVPHVGRTLPDGGAPFSHQETRWNALMSGASAGRAVPTRS